MRRRLKLWDGRLLCLISWNLEHGPNKDQGRRSEIKAKTQTVLERYRPHELPLFQSLANQMIAKLEDADMLDLSLVENKEGIVLATANGSVEVVKAVQLQIGPLREHI